MKNLPILSALLLTAAPLCAAVKWTVDDVVMMESAGETAVSRDGKLAVWVKSQMDKKKGETVSNLFLRNLAADFDVQLTQGTDTNSDPVFSPDGKRIAFLSTRTLPAGDDSDAGNDEEEDEDCAQVWVIDTRGGEAWPVTEFEKGAGEVAWIDDATLLVAATEDPSHHDQRIKERKDTSMVVEDEPHAAPVRLFRVEVKSREATRVSTNTDRIERMFVSPDGAWAVTIHQRSLRYIYDQEVRPVTFLYDLKKGGARQLFTEGKLLPEAVAWSPDSRGFYFSAPYTTHPKYHNATISLLYRCEVAAPEAAPVPLDWGNGLTDGLVALPDGFLALLANGARPRAARYTRDGTGWKRTWIESPHAGHIFAIEAGLDGRTILYEHSTASTPPQWFAASLDGAALRRERPITELNEGLKKRTLARSDVISWKGARDEQVEGILYYPHAYQAGKKYPLVVMIHGGPDGVDRDEFNDRWAYTPNLMAQRGAFVVMPNYHGSSEYGLPWAEAISGGNYNELEWIDVERGVDSLIARGLVDPAKLGILGWSNGSIIAIEITTRTTRYKAASAGAGDVNWTSDWGNAVFGRAFNDYYFGKSVLEDPQLYLKKSPLLRMDKVRTPTIIFFGTEDKQVPTEQGWQHYRALQQLGKTGVRFILFPGEGHGPRKLVHQRRKLEEELAWFDKYLFETAPDLNEALRPASPLAAALRRKGMGNVPETVLRGEIEIGRFEVTRAQYAAFDPNYKVEPGTADYPATGVSFESAKGYCEWLSKTSGTRFRLGTEEEMEDLLKSEGEENTLDYAAGYTLNPDDAGRLASVLEGLGPGAMLRPAGSFPADGEEPAFDLGGNAAEWVVAKDGSGKALGGSADRPADSKHAAPPRPDYTGFRVVKDRIQ